MFSAQPPKPMVDQRGFTDPGPCSDGNDINLRVYPRIVQESAVLLTTKQIASGSRQSGYRDFLRSRFFRTPNDYPSGGGTTRLP
jgi:hypothetical protein